MNTPRTALEELERIDARFVSGNSVPVERAHITSSEWSAIRKALSEALGGWLPIDSAPRDGTSVILSDGRTVGEGFWNDGAECHGHRGEAGFFWESDRGNLLIADNAYATHWRPLPPPPTIANGSEVEGG